MSATDSILFLARAYAAHVGIDLSAVSWRVFGDSKKLPAIDAGGDLHTRRYEKALQWFADHWPETAVWPEEIERPKGTVKAVSA